MSQLLISKRRYWLILLTIGSQQTTTMATSDWLANNDVNEAIAASWIYEYRMHMSAWWCSGAGSRCAAPSSWWWAARWRGTWPSAGRTTTDTWVQYSIVQYRLQYSTVQYSTVQTRESWVIRPLFTHEHYLQISDQLLLSIISLSGSIDLVRVF